MKIKLFAEIEVPVDERFSRTDYVTITLEDEAILELAKAITAASVQRTADKPTELREDDDSCQCLMCGDIHRRR